MLKPPRLIGRARQQRGAAIFVVTLVIALLSAMGIFAARAASLTEAAAGYERLSNQTHYVMEHGMLLTASEVGRNPAPYLQQAMLGSTCYSNTDLSTGVPQTYPCAKFMVEKIASDVASAQTSGATPSSPLVAAATGPNAGEDPGANVPGSLGPTALNPRFYVEMTDIGPTGRPPAGSTVAGPGVQFSYLQVTLNGWGQVGPNLNGSTTCGATERNAALVTARELGRAHILIGPVPK